MEKLVLKASAISIGALVVNQLIRFFGNILLARFLAPSAFGAVAIVNMILLGINLFSDIGLRQLVIEKKDELTRDFLDTVWVIQVGRGFLILLIAGLCALLIYFLQHMGIIAGNVYAEPMVPLLIVGSSVSAVIAGFESTKNLTARRDLILYRLTVFGLLSQIASLAVMAAVARATGSPWALVIGAITSSLFQVVTSYFFMPGDQNKFRVNVELAVSLFRKGRWILVSSPLTFLSGSIEVIMLGALLDTKSFGNYMIAFLLVNAGHQVASTLSMSVFFPALSSAVRRGNDDVMRSYLRYQLMMDGIIVSSAGFLLSGGSTFVSLFFDARYGLAGELLSGLAIGLVGVRYCVIEQLMNARGKFGFGALLPAMRLIFTAAGILFGNHYFGLYGAAVGVGLGWFVNWPILLWYRARDMRWPWIIELLAFAFLLAGFALGCAFKQLVVHFHLHLVH